MKGLMKGLGSIPLGNVQEARECLPEEVTFEHIFEGFEVISQAETSMVGSLEEEKHGLFELQKELNIARIWVMGRKGD